MTGILPSTVKTARCSRATSVTTGAITTKVTTAKTTSATASTIQFTVCTDSMRPSLCCAEKKRLLLSASARTMGSFCSIQKMFGSLATNAEVLYHQITWQRVVYSTTRSEKETLRSVATKVSRST